MDNMDIATTILSQLGGKRFVAFTGAKDLCTIKCGLQFSLPRNAANVNRVQITLNGKDLYDMQFLKCSFPRYNKKTFTMTEYKEVVIQEYNDVYCDQLVELFENTTELYTHF